MTNAETANAVAWRDEFPALAITVVAVIVGVVARFKGLGAWSLEVDEYYSVRAVQDILRTGLPAYDCGGFYERGIIFHYIAALLQSTGLTLELATRAVAALCSLLVLPAVFLLGKRIGGLRVGLLAVCLVSLSIWEIELSRYARMYAPFQAVFVWYAVVFVDRVVSSEERPMWPLLVLSVLGFLCWEGGVLLSLANFLPPLIRKPNGRWSGRQWIELAASGAVLFGMMASLNIAWRLLDQPRAWPEALDEAMTARIAAMGTSGALHQPLSGLLHQPMWLAALLVVGIAAIGSLAWIWTFRDRWPAVLGLLAALGAALLHQFALVFALLLLLPLLRIVDLSELFRKKAALYWGAIFASLTVWFAFGIVTHAWDGREGAAWLGDNRAVLTAYQLFRFPNVALEIIRPWSNALPVMGIALAALLAYLILRVLTRDRRLLTAERVLLIVVVVMLLAASASAPPRHETRYVYFLYPIALLLAVAAVSRLIDGRAGRLAPTLTVLLVLGGFALTDDFRPRRMAQFDHTDLGYRLGEVEGVQSQFIPRIDVRAAADWLRENAKPGRDRVINAFPSVDFYYPQFDYSFVEWTDIRFVGYACRNGTRDRWSDLPLLYTQEALRAAVAQRPRAFLVVGRSAAEKLLPGLSQARPRIVWTSATNTLFIAELDSGPPDPDQRAGSAEPLNPRT